MDGQGFVESGVMDMADFNQQMKSIIARRRKDPAAIHTIGCPVEYQVFGAEGKSLVPGELLLQGEDMQLNAMGIYPQFYRGDLSIQTAPMAARLFEAHWQHVGTAGNTVLKWVVEKITPYLGWKEFGVRLTPPKIADNMDQLMLLMQLLQAGEVTAKTIFPKVGLDWTEEQRRKRDSTVYAAKMDVENQSEMDKVVASNDALNQAVMQQQQAMAGGGAPPEGGMPPLGASGAPAADPLAQVMARIQSFASPATPVPITEYYQIAQEAAALFTALPEVAKRQKLREIDQINKPLADLIRSQMEQVNKQQNREFIAQGQAAMQQGSGIAM